jgi:DNA/RNA endonuclease YhcR with UshA esterase domain
MKFIPLLFVLLGVTPSAFAQSSPLIGPNDAAKYVGQTATVKGVVSADKASGKGNRFLNMGGAYPNQDFTGYIPTKNAGALSCIPSPLTGKTISITGPVQLYQGKPEIILQSCSQLKME